MAPLSFHLHAAVLLCAGRLQTSSDWPCNKGHGMDVSEHPCCHKLQTNMVLGSANVWEANATYVHLQDRTFFYSSNAGSRFFRNTGTSLPSYKSLHPARPDKLHFRNIPGLTFHISKVQISTK